MIKINRHLIGKFNKQNKNFGFVRLTEDMCVGSIDGRGAIDEELFKNDIFIRKADMNGAMHGDIVEIDLFPEYLWEKSPEALISKVVKRSKTQVVGKLKRRGKMYFIAFISNELKDIVVVRANNFNGARVGDIVVADIINYPTKDRYAEAKVAKILSKRNDNTGLMKALVVEKGLDNDFSNDVKNEAKQVAEVKISQECITGRRDLREKTIFTIDGAMAKDLDDAVSIELDDYGNYVLGVHIADVSHYVKEDLLLDKEALKRGNSVYLINKVIPMLPTELSNGVCSLNAGEDKLTLSCEMVIDKNGKIINYDIFESIINSGARLVYDDVSDILEKNDKWLINKYNKIYADLKLMKELAQILRKERQKQGSLDFNFPEANIILDDSDFPIAVELEERRIANRMIEEFMLAANKTVAEHCYWLKLPFVYRIHDKPDRQKIEELKQFLLGFGISMKGKCDEIYSKTLEEIMSKCQGESYETVINTVILRAMKKASYSTECKGHFGLAFKYYCHFTSPIRRYPDLIVHRIIKLILKQNEMSDESIRRLKQKTQRAAEISSATEIKAQELERDVRKMKKAEFMKQFIGRKYEGVISGVAQHGIYVELSNTIEGMVRLSDIRDDYYHYDAKNYRIIGERKHKTYTLGQKVKIKVVGAKPELRQIDFELLK